MHPVLFEIEIYGHELTAKSYTFFLVVAAVLAIGLGTAVARRRGLNARRSAVALLLGLIVTAVGARMVHWATNSASVDGFGAVVSLNRTNLSAFAGLVLGVPVAGIAARRMRVDAWRLADSSVPALALGIAVAKVGCLLNGCCFGVATHAPWGVAVASGSEAHLAQMAAGSIALFADPVPVHPSQLYEVIAALIGGAAALVLLRQQRADGVAFLVFALWFGAFRWLNLRYLYVPESSSAPKWLYPALYGLVVAVCAVKMRLLLASARAERSNSHQLQERTRV